MAPADPVRHSLYLCTSLSSPSSAASSAMSHNRPPPYPNDDCGHAGDSRGKLFEELWQACAGPLVSLPKLKHLVMYFPQGHIEQISASTNQKTECAELPKHDLPPHVLCRVVDVQLSAEPDTDEVKALFSLLPETDGIDSDSTLEEEPPSPTSKPTLHMFCKTLTASDTSTHGGFSVPRKHASCLPPLDMSRFPPTQDLEATDLHGVKWRFRHIYRGQPKRHLLTTGWSVFVSQKKLVAGDAVIFLRGESGELRVGIRRAPRQRNTPPPSVLPSQSLQMGVIATATHAIFARTIFCVYYAPRVCPAEFVIPLERFKASSSATLAVGMRFKMKFEAEDATERRYNGTITGIEDHDRNRWPDSKWRSLKVGWDEPTIYERHDRLSPWEIELCVNPTPSQDPPGPRCKRVRANVGVFPSSLAEHSLLSSGRSNAGFGSVLSANIATVLQGQEPRALGSVEDAYHRGQQTLPHSGQLLQSQHLHSQPSPLALLCRSSVGDKHSSGELFWGMPGQDIRGNYSYAPFGASQLPQQQRSMSDASRFPPSSMFGHRHPSAQIPFRLPIQQAHAGNSGLVSKAPTCQPGSLHYPGRVIDSAAGWQTCSINAPRVSCPSASNLGHLEAGITLPLGTTQAKTPPQYQHRTVHHKAPWGVDTQTFLPSSLMPMGSEEVHSGCKVFGVLLKDEPPMTPTSNGDQSGLADKVRAEDLNNIQLSNSEVEVDYASKVENIMDTFTTSSELDSQKPASDRDISREGQCRGQAAFRSCTKVVKKGSVVGRGVDLSKLSGYDQLFDELERMFFLEGQLREKEKGWQVAYSDSENDMLEVGDDPWEEFCTMARKIHILSTEEVLQGNNGTHQNVSQALYER